MKRKLILAIAVLLAIVGLLTWLLVRQTSDTPLVKVKETVIDSTANRITEIKRIGQWELLTVDCEMLVDTARKRFLLPDDRLARIYKGKVRLGINLDKAPADWIIARGDSAVSLKLPAPGVLDERFIDEANTISFYEKGHWDAAAKEAMYRTAHRRMRDYALSAENMRAAREQADTRFKSLFNSLGFKHVDITYLPQPQ